LVTASRTAGRATAQVGKAAWSASPRVTTRRSSIGEGGDGVMMWKNFTMTLLLLLIVTTPAHAVTVQEYEKFSEAAQTLYLAGVLDSWEATVGYQEEGKKSLIKVKELLVCLRKHTR